MRHYPTPGSGHIVAVVAILLVSLSAGFTGHADETQPVPPQPDNVFGIVEGMWFPELTCELGVGWERLIFDWRAHQPDSPSDFVPFQNIPDEWLTAADACGREVVGVVKNVPPWATDGTPGAGVPRGLYQPVDHPDNIWARFMRQVASYYASRGVHRFIILNEPDIEPGTYGFEFEGTLEDYARMVKVASIAAHQGNPAAKIHLAGTTYWHDVNSGDRLYTDRLLENLANDPDADQHDGYFDALSLHIYFRSDTVYDIVTIYREMLDQYGFQDKAIWINETNASPNLDPDWPVERPQFQITLEQQASFLMQAAVQGIAAGAERIAAYKLYDQDLPEGAESFGLLNPGDESPRPAFTTWETVVDRLNGVHEASLARGESANAGVLRHHDGHQTIAAWARTETPVTLEVQAASSKAYLFNQYGEHVIRRPQDGVYTIDLPPATCEPEPEGCVVGGPVQLLVQPGGDISLTAITASAEERLEPGIVPFAAPRPEAARTEAASGD